MTKIKAIILDWAGTTVDFGCFAPVEAFISAFQAFGITPTMDETRAPMGMEKRAHIRTMLNGERLTDAWRQARGHAHTEEDIDAIYARFEPSLFATLGDYARPLPGVLDAVAQIREMGVKIGSTTGYTKAMMNVVAPVAAKHGYAPDCLVCPEEVSGAGRPYPYMLWRNLEKLGILSVNETLKIGDTAADMAEGRNAGCLCVGVIAGSSMLGLSEDEFSRLDDAEKASLFAQTRKKYLQAGADYVIDDIRALPELIKNL